MTRTEHYRPDEIFIVKVQLSVMTMYEEPIFLVYDEHRIIMDQFPQSELPELAEAMGKDLKRFFYADISEKGLLNINTLDPVPWQDW